MQTDTDHFSHIVNVERMFMQGLEHFIRGKDDVMDESKKAKLIQEITAEMYSLMQRAVMLSCAGNYKQLVCR